MSRTSKLAIGGVAALSAAAIAVTPVTPTSPALLEAQQRSMSVDLVAQVTDSPTVVYGEFFDNTVANITGLAAAVQANPAPLLSQIFENQQGYFTRFTDVLEAWPAGVEAAFSETGNVGPHIAAMQQAIEAGEIFTAYQEYNAASLYASLAIVSPFTNLLLSRNTRATAGNPSVYVPGIPEEIAQNFANAVAVLFSSTALQSGIFYSSFAVLSGVPYEGARVADALYKAVQANDFETAGNVLVNAPATLTNAFLNGFDYSDTDTTEAWPGLLAPVSSVLNNQGNPVHPGGLIYQALVGLPKSIAKAIDNTPEVAPSASRSGVPGEDVEADKGSETIAEQPELNTGLAGLEGNTTLVSETPGDAKVLTKLTKKELVSTDTAEAPETKATSKAAERAAKAKANVAQVNDRINSAVKKVGDGLKKLTGNSKSKTDNGSNSNPSGDSSS